jgi:hypothetical protein
LICTKFDAVLLLDPSQNRIRPDTWLQIKGCKQSARPPSCEWNILHWLPKSGSTTLALCFYNWFIDGSTSPRYYGYSLVFLHLLPPNVMNINCTLQLQLSLLCGKQLQIYTLCCSDN